MSDTDLNALAERLERLADDFRAVDVVIEGDTYTVKCLDEAAQALRGMGEVPRSPISRFPGAQLFKTAYSDCGGLGGNIGDSVESNNPRQALRKREGDQNRRHQGLRVRRSCSA